MLRDWCASGFDPDAFWRQTPATFATAMDGVALRARFDAERDVARAHVSAMFARAEKLKPLDHYLLREGEREPAASGDMLERLKQIAAATEHLA